MKVLIAVTHLLGSGHLARALVLAQAFRTGGHHVHLVSGGMPLAHLDTDGLAVTQLAPLRSDGVNFTRLLDETGAEASRALLDGRIRDLTGVLHSTAPDAVITELYPFGRRILAQEFQALLSAAQTHTPKPVVCASIRDILAPPSKPAKAAQTESLIKTLYDAVLVHSDPTITPLEISWPVTPALSEALRYTGYVAAPPASPPSALGRDKVVVSAGGGNVGTPLYQACVAAARLDPAVQWHVLVGGRDAAARVAELSAHATSNICIEPARPEFRQMLYHAKASVSMCGYNTALDILQAGVPALFVPFDEGGEVEQSLRAQALSALPGIGVVKAQDLTAETLLAQVRQIGTGPRRAPLRQGFDGAAQSVRIVEGLVRDRDHAV